MIFLGTALGPVALAWARLDGDGCFLVVRRQRFERIARLLRNSTLVQSCSWYHTLAVVKRDRAGH